VNLNIFGLSAISYDLLEKYPSIAKDYLGVEVDTYLKPLIRLASSTRIRKSPESEKYDLISSNKPVSLLNIQ
jgi:hypothetical protein